MKLKTLMSTVATLAAAVGAGPATAATANGPICDTAAYVNSTTHYRW
ncbi:hypothetical protein OV208_17435 [Corallococcus sp. bb12-1]|nr:hypothetical protein [Corallococcus sp. bb12-1]MCY1043108.1 hypothetical protein [Corallococcus sp. bb12-1]